MTINKLHKITCATCAFVFLGLTILIAQKLPNVRVEQKVVSEEAAFIEANRERLLGNYDVAEEKILSMIDRYGKKAVYYYELARIYEEVSELKKAIETNKEGIKLEPNNEWYWQYQANLGIELEDHEVAIEAFSSLAELFPDRHYYLENIAFHQLTNRKPKEALKTLSQLEKRAGINYETTRQKHLIKDEIGDVKGAAEELDKYIQQYPMDVRIIKIAASYAIQQENISSAKKYYQNILSIDPDDALANSAIIKLDLNIDTKNDRLDAFIEDRNIPLDDKLKQLIPLLDDYANGNSDMNIEQLESYSNTIIEQYGESDKTLALLGDVYSLQNRLDAAANSYIKSIKFNDGNYFVFEQLLYVLADLKDSNKLSEYAEEAMDLYPNKPMPSAFYALTLALKNKFDKTDKYLEQAKLISGNNPEFIQQVHQIERLIDQLRGQ